MDLDNFKQCPGCKRWLSAKEILDGIDITPIGLALGEDDPTQNLCYFNHEAENCRTTFTIPVTEFELFIIEQRPPEIKALRPECERHCVNKEDFQLCQIECKFAPYRRFMLSLIATKKRLAKTALV